MEIYHKKTARGWAFLWGGIALGSLLVAALFTHGFGLLSPQSAAGGETPLLLHKGDQIIIPEGSPLRERLTVMPAAAEAVSAKLVLPGIVESDPARTAAVLTPLGGRVIELKVALGERVAAGQVLALIDSPDLAQAFEENDKAAANFELTGKTLERQRAQYKIGATADRDLDQARSDHAQATAEYMRTRARLKAIGAPAVPTDSQHLLAVRSPLDGGITTLSIAPGNMINDPTQPIMTVADLSTVWVTALVPEKDVGGLARGQAADVTLSAYPGQILHGKVLFVSDVFDADSHRVKLRIPFANPRYNLKPNMYATVTLFEAQQSRVVLPTSALLMNNDRTSVFVATAPWTFERRTVEPQMDEGPSVVIRSGVTAGEQVVVKGGILLND